MCLIIRASSVLFNGSPIGTHILHFSIQIQNAIVKCTFCFYNGVYSQANERVNHFGAGLMHLNLAPDVPDEELNNRGCIGIFSKNRVRNLTIWFSKQKTVHFMVWFSRWGCLTARFLLAAAQTKFGPHHSGWATMLADMAEGRRACARFSIASAAANRFESFVA